MRIASIQIENLAAFPKFEAKVPAIALLQGKNGLGKSSLMNVVKYAFGRRAEGSRSVEHDPRMIHGNAERGEATLTFDDGSQLRVLVTKEETSRMTKPKDGKRWAKSSGDIDALANALSYDPIQFKGLSEKQRVETLLRIMPATVTAEEIQAAIGDVAVARPQTPGLEAINAYYGEIYELRTYENSAADRLTKHAEELEAALPPAVEGNIDVATLRAEKGALDEAERVHVKTVGDTFRAYEAEERAAHAKRVEVSLAFCTENIEKARQEANSSVAEKRSAHSPEHERLTAEIATAEERQRAVSQAEGTRKAVESARAEAGAHKTKSASLTAALERLNLLKSTVAGRLPIKGITIAAPKQGLPVDICREEKGALVPFSMWNDTSKVLFCLRIAVLSHGQCGLVCVDSIDAIDPEVRKALEATCKKYADAEGMQFLLGEATGGELRITELEGAEGN